MSTRPIEGEYPDWRSLRPDSWDLLVEMPAAELAEAVSRLLPLLEPGQPVRLGFATDGAVTVTAGETTETLPVSAQLTPARSEGMTIGFAGRWLAEAIKSGGPLLRLHLISPVRPALFANGRDEAWHLLMPIR